MKKHNFKINFTFALILITTMTQAQINKNKIKAPLANKKPIYHEIHGDKRLDNYHWMRLSDEQKNAKEPDQQTKEVVAYLEQENAYTEKMMAHTQKFQEELYDEIVGRIKQTDMSVPYFLNGYYYITRYEEGKEYAIYSRKKGNLKAEEDILLDVNKLAEGHEFYAVGALTVGLNNKIMAYAEDTLSRRIYTIKFKNLETGEILKEEIGNTSGNITWAKDSKTLFYTIKDPALRAYKVMKHVLGTDPQTDQEIYHEKDETYACYVSKTKSRQYLVIGSYSTLSQEYRYLDANTPDGEFSVFQARETNLEYSIDHKEDKWYIRNNIDAQNFKLSVCPLNKTSKEHWKELIPTRDQVLLEGFDLFKNHLVLSERKEGITNIRIISEQRDYNVDFGEKAYLAYTSTNPEFNTKLLRLEYTSLTTPNTTFELNMDTKNKKVISTKS